MLIIIVKGDKEKVPVDVGDDVERLNRYIDIFGRASVLNAETGLPFPVPEVTEPVPEPQADPIATEPAQDEPAIVDPAETLNEV